MTSTSCRNRWIVLLISGEALISDIHPTLVLDDVSTRYINVTCGDAKKAKYEFIMESGNPDKYAVGFGESCWKVSQDVVSSVKCWALRFHKVLNLLQLGSSSYVLRIHSANWGKKAILYIDDKQLSLEDKPVEIELKKGLTDCVGWWRTIRCHIVQYGAMYSTAHGLVMYRLFLSLVDVWLNWLNGEVNISSVWTTSAMARTSTVVCLISMERKMSIPILTV